MKPPQMIINFVFCSTYFLFGYDRRVKIKLNKRPVVVFQLAFLIYLVKTNVVRTAFNIFPTEVRLFLLENCTKIFPKLYSFKIGEFIYQGNIY